MTHATLRPEFEELIDPYAPVGQVGTGFTFTEGPIWHPVEHYLLFSDMPADVRRRWDAARGVAEVRRPSNKCNGMTKRAEKGAIKKVLANARFILPVHDRPAKVESGVVVARLQDSVPGPIVQTLPKRNWFPA